MLAWLCSSAAEPELQSVPNDLKEKLQPHVTKAIKLLRPKGCTCQTFSKKFPIFIILYDDTIVPMFTFTTPIEERRRIQKDLLPVKGQRTFDFVSVWCVDDQYQEFTGCVLNQTFSRKTIEKFRNLVWKLEKEGMQAWRTLTHASIPSPDVPVKP